MLRSLWSSASGMTAQTAKMDIIANNLANVNTTAYKKQQASFSDLFYQALDSTSQPIKIDPAGKPWTAGAGVKINDAYNLFTQGALMQTGRDLDLAIQGKGFLEVELPNGQLAYTRDGVLQVDNEGMLTNALGYRLAAQLTVPVNSRNLTIAENGSVQATLEDGTVEEIGVLPIYNIDNLFELVPIGKNMFVIAEGGSLPLEGTAGTEGMGVFKQGCLEGSNVNAVEEMTQMISAQRAYQFNSRLIQTSDEMWGLANNLRG